MIGCSKSQDSDGSLIELNTETAATGETEISGVLPNGDRYVVRAQPALNGTVEGISAAIIIDIDDGEDPIEGPVAGITAFLPDDGTRLRLFNDQDSSVVVVSGSYYMYFNAYDHIVAELGESTKSILLDSIISHDLPHESGLPAFELQAPLRWADNNEIPSQMMVVYSNFVVRRGCSNLAVACSPDESVEVVPSDRVFSGEPSWTGNTVEITTP